MHVEVSLIESVGVRHRPARNICCPDKSNLHYTPVKSDYPVLSDCYEGTPPYELDRQCGH